MSRYQTFIIRIWADEGAKAIRGQIQHVGSRRSTYFRDSHRMLRFIDECLGPHAICLADPSRSLSTSSESEDESPSIPPTAVLHQAGAVPPGEDDGSASLGPAGRPNGG